jgi:hypothetical protein
MQAAQRFTLAAISRHGVAGGRIVRQAVLNGVALIFRQAPIQPGVQVFVGNARAGVVRVHDGVRFGHFRRRKVGAPLAAGRAARLPAGASSSSRRRDRARDRRDITVPTGMASTLATSS